MVTGSVVNGNTDSRAGWGSYFLDHATQLPGRQSGEFQGVPGHASYVTDDLRRVGGFPEHVRAGEDTAANRRLHLAGVKSYFCANASFHHASPCRSLGDVIRHHYNRGRALGRLLAIGTHRPFSRRRIKATFAAARRRLRRIRETMETADEELQHEYRSARPYVIAGALGALAGSIREVSRPPIADGREDLELPPDAAAGTGPLLAVGGRPGITATGLLGIGRPMDGAQRLATFTRYARHQTDVLSALAPIVTSATVTTEHLGTHTIDMNRSDVAEYLDAARAIGASLLLQMQPGSARLLDLVERWADLLAEPDVGVLFDVRAHVAHRRQIDDLPAVVEQTAAHTDRSGSFMKRVFVRGVDRPRVPPAAVVVDAIDLRKPGSLLPHELFEAHPDTAAVIYD